jgi:putative oxygen-independent coproporphyrinogen III oxidase
VAFAGETGGEAPTDGSFLDGLTGMPAARLGLYVHFPWCLAKCPYCDFAVTVSKEIPSARYTAALLRELALRLRATPSFAAQPLGSVYLGGGTPSLWAPAEVAAFLKAVQTRLRLWPGAEVTLEANPEVADEKRLSGFRAAGVNRLSLGVQSFDARTLKVLGRAHAPDDGRQAVAAARRAGFDNVSLDVILGVEGQSLLDAVEDAKAAAALSPDHVSAYVLTVERDALAEETVFSRRLRTGELELPPEGLVADMVEAVTDVLSASGLQRYEVSSYARAGKHSRHNALYWTCGEYLGLGAGATGFWRTKDGGLRTSGHRSTERWFSDVEAGRLPEAEREALGPGELFRERLMLGLRFTTGLDVEALVKAFGEASRSARLLELAAQGLAEAASQGRVRLTRRGLLLHSDVCARLL